MKILLLLVVLFAATTSAVSADGGGPHDTRLINHLVAWNERVHGRVTHELYGVAYPERVDHYWTLRHMLSKVTKGPSGVRDLSWVSYDPVTIAVTDGTPDSEVINISEHENGPAYVSFEWLWMNCGESQVDVSWELRGDRIGVAIDTKAPLYATWRQEARAKPLNREHSTMFRFEPGEPVYVQIWDEEETSPFNYCGGVFTHPDNLPTN
jgi:hypothetical protein